MIDKKSKSAIIFATILLFVALVVLILYLLPKISQLKTLSNQVESKKIEYETGKLRIDNIAALNEMVGQYKRQAELLGIALPSSGRAEDALLELSSAASDSNLQVISAEVNPEGKGSLQVSISTRGTFENSVGFINKLKSNLRPIKVLDLSMNKSDDEIITSLDLNFPFFVEVSATVSKTPANSTSEAK